MPILGAGANYGGIVNIVNIGIVPLSFTQIGWIELSGRDAGAL